MSESNSEKTDPNVEEGLQGLDQDKRATLRRLARGGAFVGPIVATFAMQGISIRQAQAGSSSNSTHVIGVISTD